MLGVELAPAYRLAAWKQGSQQFVHEPFGAAAATNISHSISYNVENVTIACHPVFLHISPSLHCFKRPHQETPKNQPTKTKIVTQA